MANNEGSFRATAIIRVNLLPTPTNALRGKIFFLPTGAGGFAPGYYVVSNTIPYIWINFTEVTVTKKYSVTTAFLAGEGLDLLTGDAANVINGASTTTTDVIILDTGWELDGDTVITLNGQDLSKGDQVILSFGKLIFTIDLDQGDIIIVTTKASL